MSARLEELYGVQVVQMDYPFAEDTLPPAYREVLETNPNCCGWCVLCWGGCLCAAARALTTFPQPPPLEGGSGTS